MKKKTQIQIPTARQLPSGNWFVQLRVGGQSISITKPTEKEAIAEAMAIKQGIIQADRKAQKKTLHAAIDDYIDNRKNILSPSTIRGYKAIQNGRFQSMMQRDINTITREQWQRAVSREAKLVSAKTLTNAWRFISSVIVESTGKKIEVRLPQIIPNDRPFLEPDQIQRFVDAIKGRSIEVPALLALSGLRRSELLNLRWEDVDLEKGIIQVNGAAVYDENSQLVRKLETKNRASRRVVPIIPPLRAAMENATPQGEYVVKIKPSALYAHINRVCTANDLPKVGIHGLRHSFASLAYHLGIPEKVAMEIGGWSNDQTMHKIYTHIARADVAKHTNALTNFFNGDTKC